jgi:hypothetical protein
MQRSRDESKICSSESRGSAINAFGKKEHRTPDRSKQGAFLQNGTGQRRALVALPCPIELPSRPANLPPKPPRPASKSKGKRKGASEPALAQAQDVQRTRPSETKKRSIASAQSNSGKKQKLAPQKHTPTAASVELLPNDSSNKQVPRPPARSKSDADSTVKVAQKACPAHSSIARPAVQALSKPEKDDLKNKIGGLDDEAMERLIDFLQKHGDLPATDDGETELSLELDSLRPERQRSLVAFVQRELDLAASYMSVFPEDAHESVARGGALQNGSSGRPSASAGTCITASPDPTAEIRVAPPQFPEPEPDNIGAEPAAVVPSLSEAPQGGESMLNMAEDVLNMVDFGWNGV